MNTMLKMIGAMICLMWAATANAAEEVLFSEDFEAPDVSAFTLTAPPSWIRAAQGYMASQNGLTDKITGNFTALDPNHQAYAFRYSSNVGVTSKEGVIGPFVTTTVYTVTFDVVKDNTSAATKYSAKFMTIPAGVARDDCRSDPAGSVVLATANGNAPTNGTFQTVTIQYTYDSAHAVGAGDDLAIRFATGYMALLDNVQVTWVAPPPAGTVIIIK